jgi:hypothetical protein
LMTARFVFPSGVFASYGCGCHVTITSTALSWFVRASEFSSGVVGPYWLSPPSLLFVPQSQESALRSFDTRVCPPLYCKQHAGDQPPLLFDAVPESTAVTRSREIKPDDELVYKRTPEAPLDSAPVFGDDTSIVSSSLVITRHEAGLSPSRCREILDNSSHGVRGPYSDYSTGDRSVLVYLTNTIHSQGFSPSQWFDPARALWFCFTPLPLLGFLVFRAFPSQPDTTAFTALCSHVVGLAPARFGCPNHPFTAAFRYLQVVFLPVLVPSFTAPPN